MVKSSEFHRLITKRGKKRGWKWLKGEGEGSHRIYEDKNGIRYPVPYHGAKEMGEGLRKKIIRDMELEYGSLSTNQNINLNNCVMDKIVKVTIEKGPDLFSAWADDIPGIYGEGESVKDVKDDILRAVELYKANNEEKNIPEVLKGDVQFEWHFDVQSFLVYYSGIFTKAALERITGVNQKQLGHYASGLKKPRKSQVEKIDTALQRFFSEMQMVRLV